ncbi:uncharacterized protein LOC133860210 isoform X2 [Alnus glutinosa]|uniref:uncharacterized protein LOC133860210 isoform X2 n=1 Tax=Alnus glutinosa TaxID=3517 RepID=UPI002D79A07C|nr:uncharacterized protein LOC133860210 isoform X2 [Alnus glutinosa]
MGHTSKDLLQLEHKNSSTSPLESTLLVCKKDSVSQPQKPLPHGKPITAPLPKSEVFGKVKDFLGIISAANERLQLGAKDNSENYDIEVLTGNESEIIEMAVAVAESTIASYQPIIPLAASSSGTDSEDSSDVDEDDDNGDNDAKERCSHLKLQRSESGQDNSSSEDVPQSEKRRKIVELS